MMSQPKVFISYSGSDASKDWLEEFVRSLERRKLSVWIDQEALVQGTSLIQEMTKALRSSDIIVSLLEKESDERPNVYFELGVALALGKRMVAIVPPNFDLKLLPDPLRERSFLIKRSPDETAESVASIAGPPVAQHELSDAELERVAQHITNYLHANSFTKVSFEKIRERINPNYTDDLLLNVIDKLPQQFRRVRLKGGASGIGLVKKLDSSTLND